MRFKAVSWNMGGAGNDTKIRWLRGKIRQNRPWLLALQETKMGFVTRDFIRLIWGNQQCSWAFYPLLVLLEGCLLSGMLLSWSWWIFLKVLTLLIFCSRMLLVVNYGFITIYMGQLIVILRTFGLN